MDKALHFGPLKKTEADRIEAWLGDDVICSRCGANIDSYPNRCSELISGPCPGFLLIEGIRLHFRRTADA